MTLHSNKSQINRPKTFRFWGGGWLILQIDGYSYCNYVALFVISISLLQFVFAKKYFIISGVHLSGRWLNQSNGVDPIICDDPKGGGR